MELGRSGCWVKGLWDWGEVGAGERCAAAGQELVLRVDTAG